VRENGNSPMCSYRTVEGVTWVLPTGQLAAAHGTDDGRTMRIFYAGAEVHLEGAHLQKVREAITRGHGFLVRAVSPTFKSEYEDEVFVSLVRVIETRPSKAGPDEAAAP